jgi:hypothetical protein
LDLEAASQRGCAILALGTGGTPGGGIGQGVGGWGAVRQGPFEHVAPKMCVVMFEILTADEAAPFAAPDCLFELEEWYATRRHRIKITLPNTAPRLQRRANPIFAIRDRSAGWHPEPVRK